MSKEITAAPGVQVIRRSKSSVKVGVPVTRVAAYCRVSTDNIIQKSSLDTQISAFKNVISNHPGWVLAEIYADDGLSGTSAKNRTEFQRMISDCEDGKIDYILTKSISRFARNTMDCLSYVRKLKNLGIYVLFDENNLDTGNAASEMLLSILAAVAQEESHSISENMKWGFRKRFAEGKPKWSRTYGWLLDESGNMVVNEDEAVIVRRIFDMYNHGLSLPKIAEAFNAEGIPTANNNKWWPKTISEVLHNEKNVGDLVMQKSYIEDYLTHKKVRNDQTVVPSYKVQEHHKGIVDRNTFDMAQTILSMRNTRQGCMQYPYYGTLVCPICGEPMIGCHLPINSYPGAWTCGGERDDIIAFDPFLSDEQDGSIIKNSACQHYAVRTKYVDRIVKAAYSELDIDNLRMQAQKHSALGRVAQKAFVWKTTEPELKSVEYFFLTELVDSITFHITPKGGVQWNVGVVNWAFGVKSMVQIKYDKPGDTPYAPVSAEHKVSNTNAIRHYNSIENCCEKVRRQGARPRPFRGSEVIAI